MRKIFIILFLSMSVCCAALFFSVFMLLNSAPIYEYILPRVCTESVCGSRIERLSLQDAVLGFDGRYVLEAVRLEIKRGQDSFYTAFDELIVSNIVTLVCGIKDSQVDLSVRNCLLQSAAHRCEGVDVQATVSYPEPMALSARGQITAREILFESLRVTDISALFECSSRALRIYNVNGDFYGGSVLADMLYALDGKRGFEGRINIAGIDMERVGEDRPDMTSQVEGIATVSVSLRGQEDMIESIDIAARFTKNGKISAVLLQPLLAYIPQHSMQRKELERLVDLKQKIDLDRSVLRLKNAGPDTLRATVQLQSVRFNLDINLTIDINVEGGVINLIDVLSLDQAGA